ncbi:3845da0f-41b2-4f82-a540-c03e03548a8e [Sclerotinia trifoliorum]|uniref:3845da0f-41b2-4f82-a540-c03e03548a8e n=1 Tax=Sclerotinia trifoliorum TaxID=28548 RepID=A0A8H2VQW6_9HELO|nr:3845da0f-41b2-4f82-a540-c03e03548a8e [Sclerotinia trifoliorum]
MRASICAPWKQRWVKLIGSIEIETVRLKVRNVQVSNSLVPQSPCQDTSYPTAATESVLTQDRLTNAELLQTRHELLIKEKAQLHSQNAQQETSATFS